MEVQRRKTRKGKGESGRITPRTRESQGSVVVCACVERSVIYGAAPRLNQSRSSNRLTASLQLDENQTEDVSTR